MTPISARAHWRELVGHEARRAWSHHQTREQIAHDRRQAELVHGEAEHERCSEAAADREDEIEVVHCQV